MNNTTKIIMSTLLTVASSVSCAETGLQSHYNTFKIGDKFEQGYSRSIAIGFANAINTVRNNMVVIQFNVRSTNKSQYNAVYLDTYNERIDGGPGSEGLSGDFCDPVGDNVPDDSAYLVTYLPYSPHKEVHNNEEWDNGWRSVHTVVRMPDRFYQQDEVILRVCSRDKDGDVVGDLDNFEIKDIMIHYQTEDEEQGPTFYGRYTE